MEVCSICKKKFDKEIEYLEHTCSNGFKPTEPQSMGDAYLEIQKAALERGAKNN